MKKILIYASLLLAACGSEYDFDGKIGNEYIKSVQENNQLTITVDRPDGTKVIFQDYLIDDKEGPNYDYYEIGKGYTSDVTLREREEPLDQKIQTEYLDYLKKIKNAKK